MKDEWGEIIQQLAMESCYSIFGEEGTAFLVKAIQDTFVMLAFASLMWASTGILTDLAPVKTRPIFELIHEVTWIVGVLTILLRWVKYLWKTTFGNENG